MAQSFFIWNGQDCRAMGVTMRGPVPIIRPEERVRHVEIPGRSGDLTETEGENIYNSYIQTASISVCGGFRVREVYKWLRGAGYVTFSGEPDKRQAARIIGAVTLNKISRNMDRWAGEVQFYCQPLKERIRETAEEIAAGGSIVNMGDVEEKPVWRLTPAGNSIMISAGGKSLTVTGLTAGAEIVIDSGAESITTADGETELTRNSVGDFPTLPCGKNTVAGSGWSTASVTRKERFL